MTAKEETGEHLPTTTTNSNKRQKYLRRSKVSPNCWIIVWGDDGKKSGSKRSKAATPTDLQIPCRESIADAVETTPDASDAAEPETRHDADEEEESSSAEEAPPRAPSESLPRITPCIVPLSRIETPLAPPSNASSLADTDDAPTAPPKPHPPTARQPRGSDALVPCPQCDRVFKRMDRLKDHVDTTHEHKVFICVICEKKVMCSSNRAAHLKQHGIQARRSHTPSKKFFRVEIDVEDRKQRGYKQPKKVRPPESEDVAKMESSHTHADLYSSPSKSCSNGPSVTSQPERHPETDSTRAPLTKLIGEDKKLVSIEEQINPESVTNLDPLKKFASPLNLVMKSNLASTNLASTSNLMSNSTLWSKLETQTEFSLAGNLSPASNVSSVNHHSKNFIEASFSTLKNDSGINLTSSRNLASATNLSSETNLSLGTNLLSRTNLMSARSLMPTTNFSSAKNLSSSNLFSGMNFLPTTNPTSTTFTTARNYTTATDLSSPTSGMNLSPAANLTSAMNVTSASNLASPSKKPSSSLIVDRSLSSFHTPTSEFPPPQPVSSYREISARLQTPGCSGMSPSTMHSMTRVPNNIFPSHLKANDLESNRPKHGFAHSAATQRPLLKFSSFLGRKDEPM